MSQNASSPLVSICIACHNQEHLLFDALGSCYDQTYKNIEVIVLDDASNKPIFLIGEKIRVFRSEEPSGTGGAFNKAIGHAIGEITVLLCADDFFIDKNVISDIVSEFDNPEIGHVSRWYHQFVDGDRSPVRAWRGENVIELANNPSGMAFRRSAIIPALGVGLIHGLTNKMFVEVAQMVEDVLGDGWAYSILRYDTVAVRIHQSISRTPGYYKKMWNSSPVEEWAKLGWISTDYTHLIQVAVNFEKKAVLSEIRSFIRINPICIFNPVFMFFSITALCTPRCVLYHIPELYRSTFGKMMTIEVKRAS